MLLHGWGGCIASMSPIREALRVDHTVVSVDLPGFGASEMPREVWGSAEYAACVAELLARLDVRSVTCVVGHSFGGKVAIQLALQAEASRSARSCSSPRPACGCRCPRRRSVGTRS